MSGSEEFNIPILEPGVYEHYKGNRYEALYVACHSETLEWLVVYRPLYEHEGNPDIWVRPYEMFIGNVDYNGETVPRFKKLK